MISKVVLVVVVGILIVLQLDYILDLSQYVHLTYLGDTVVLTFLILFLVSLYLVYRLTGIQQEIRRYKSHGYISTEEYERAKKELSEIQVDKLKNSKEYKEWRRTSNKQEGRDGVTEEERSRQLQTFQEDFGIVVDLPEQ